MYAAGTIFVFQASGLHPVSPNSLNVAHAALAFFQQALMELSEIWPAATQAAESLVALQAQYGVSVV